MNQIMTDVNNNNNNIADYVVFRFLCAEIPHSVDLKFNWEC